MSNSRLHRCLEPGLSVLVATVDAQGTPASCRAIALASDDDLETVTVYLPVATCHEAIQNLAITKRLAVAATNPVDNSATQLKGTTLEARLAREDEAAFVNGRLEAFAEMLAHIGVPRRTTRSVAHWPAFAVRVRVEQIFDQTPGPKAGSRIR